MISLTDLPDIDGLAGDEVHSSLNVNSDATF